MNKRLLAGFLALILVFTGISIPQKVNAAPSQEANTTTLENDLSVEGTNSFGNLLAEKLSEKEAEQLENNGCNVFSIEVSEKEATVSFETAKDATLLVVWEMERMRVVMFQ